MQNFIIAGIITLILGFSIRYIIKAKKRGVKCIGCVHSDECGKKKCGCDSSEKEIERKDKKYNDILNYDIDSINKE